MIWIARVFGLLLLVYGLLGLYFTYLNTSQGYPIPAWNDLPWTADVRRGADWALYAALLLAGVLMLFGKAAARLLILLALVVAAGKTGYDLWLGDPATARHEIMVRADFIALGVSAVALLASVLTLKSRAPKRGAGAESLGSADA